MARRLLLMFLFVPCLLHGSFHQLLTNVALNKTCSLSTIYHFHGPGKWYNIDDNTCEAAINDNTDRNHSKGNCIWTDWVKDVHTWTVDLGQTYDIVHIVIYPWAKWLKWMTAVIVSIDDHIVYVFPNEISRVSDPTNIYDGTIPGRTVTLSRRRDQKPPDDDTSMFYMAFCEVQVWAILLDVPESGTSKKTSALTKLAQSDITPQTVARTKEVLSEGEESSAADVLQVATIVQSAISQLDNISAQTATNLLEIVDTISELNQTVLEQSNSDGNTTNRLIHSVEQLADKVNIGTNGSLLLKTNQTVLKVWNLTSLSEQSSYMGLQQLSSNGQTKDVNSLGAEADSERYADVDAASFLPADIGRKLIAANSNSDVRFSAMVMNQTSLFQVLGTSERRAQLNSKVISLRITVDAEPETNLSAFGQNNGVTNVFQPTEHSDVVSQRESGVHCVFWDFLLDEGRGAWSNQGCALKEIVSGKVVCECTHLTNFAILMDLHGQGESPGSMQDTILSLVTWLGLSCSIAGLSATVLCFVLIKQLHDSLPQQTLFNIALSMLLAWVVFLAGIRRKENHVACVAVAMLLHYLILVSFLWMLTHAVLLYVNVVKGKQLPCSRYTLKAALPCWGLPLILVIVVSVFDVGQYHRGDNYCWMDLEAFYYAFLAPIAVLLVVNSFIYIVVVASICHRPHLSRVGTSHTTVSVRAAICCFVILGLNWVFAFFAIEGARVVFQYLFTVTSTFQGVFIFMLYTARDPTVKAFWLKVFRTCCKMSSDPMDVEMDMTSADNTPPGLKISTKETSY